MSTSTETLGSSVPTSSLSNLRGGSWVSIASHFRRHAQRSTSYSEVERVVAGDPLIVLSSLMDTLKKNQIPGPRLLRLQHEFTEILGTGAQFDVLGAPLSLPEDLCNGVTFPQGCHGPLSPIVTKKDADEYFKCVAIKRSKAPYRPTSVPKDVALQDLTQQLRFAQSEIYTLSHAPFRDHDHIVKLLAWGLCLDTLEDRNLTALRIPLLVLERAVCNLFESLQANLEDENHLDQSARLQVCFDVGSGLSALHAESVTHGDLKPQNVLMFRKEGSWVAKLCDFGLSAEDRHDEGTTVRYGGTMGWRPREAMFQNDCPLTSGSCQSCDVFAYGLLVWSIFLLRGHCPLTETQERDGVANRLAAVDIDETEWLSSAHKSRLAFVCQSCLSPDPKARDRHPWKYLKMNIGLARPVRLFEKINGRGISVRSYVNVDLSPFSRLIKTVVPGTQLSTTSPSSLPQDRQWKFKATFSYERFIERIPMRRKAYLQFAELFPSLSRTTANNTCSVDQAATVMVEHLYSRLLGALSCHQHPQSPKLSQESSLTIYALSCLRSTIDLATWKRTRELHDLPNMVETVFTNATLVTSLTIEMLAWLCKGDIGKQEITEAIENGTDLWHGCLTFLGFGNSKAEEVFLLLLAYGCNPGDLVASNETQALGEFTGRPSVFRCFLNKILQCPIAEFRSHSESLIVEVCNRFHRMATDESLSPRTRYFMTGHLPSTMQADTPTTALHDCAFSFSYAGVEQLIRNGFLVDCLNAKGFAAIQIVEQKISYLATLGPTKPPSDAYRILALLRQHGSSTLHETILPDWYFLGYDDGLGLGWQRISVAGSHPVFRESWSGSITFRRPTFSLFEDRQLALGQRRMIGGGEGQVYYLDLIRFISQEPIVVGMVQRRNDLFPLFDDAWYEEEPKQPDPITPRSYNLINISKWPFSHMSGMCGLICIAQVLPIQT